MPQLGGIPNHPRHGNQKYLARQFSEEEFEEEPHSYSGSAAPSVLEADAASVAGSVPHSLTCAAWRAARAFLASASLVRV